MQSHGHKGVNTHTHNTHRKHTLNKHNANTYIQRTFTHTQNNSRDVMMSKLI